MQEGKEGGRKEVGKERRQRRDGGKKGKCEVGKRKGGRDGKRQRKEERQEERETTKEKRRWNRKKRKYNDDLFRSQRV